MNKNWLIIRNLKNQADDTFLSMDERQKCKF